MKISNFSCIKYLTIIIFLFIGQSGKSCINEHRVLLNGSLIYTDGENASPGGRFNKNDKAYLLEILNEADSIYTVTGKLEDYSDLGAMLVYNGQYLKAKKIFQEIERKSPGLYQTAANLGTTYELIGKNDSALYWIKRAIQINPDSHGGSEWIHVKILEAKIKANGNEELLWKYYILSLDFGDGEIPVNKNNIELNELQQHLYDQLNERMSFIDPKDPIVAQLLFDLGNVVALTRDVTSGLQIFQSAKDYGYSSDVFEKRITYFKKLQKKADFRNNAGDWVTKNRSLTLTTVVIIFIIGILIVAGLFVMIRKRHNKKRN